MNTLLTKIECTFLTVLTAILLCAIPVQAAPFGYVANRNSNSVSVIDSATNTLKSAIPVGSLPDSRSPHTGREVCLCYE